MRKRLVAAGAAALTVVLGVTVAVAADGDNSNNVRKAIETGKAKNVILLIGDGMGDSEITIARNYTVGAAGRLALDELPLTGQMTTYSVTADGKPDYDPESASTGTAWATGNKTVDGRISTSPADQAGLPGSDWIPFTFIGPSDPRLVNGGSEAITLYNLDPAKLGLREGWLTNAPGDYRIYVQIRRAGQVETGVFDAHVN